MTEISDGGTVHPIQSSHRGPRGISYRDWMASAAMQGLLQSATPLPPEELADAAYQYADAMLAKRRRDRQAGLEEKWATETF